MQESTLRAHELLLPRLFVDVGARLLGRWVEPVGDVRARRDNDRVTLLAGMVPIDQKGQVIDFIEEGNPDVSAGVVGGDLLGCVEAAKFVGARDVLRLFDARGARFSRGRDPCSHHHFCFCSLRG